MAVLQPGFKTRSFAKLAVILLAWSHAHAADSPTLLDKDRSKVRVASTSLCGDSYLLALAPDHVSALSWQSRHALSQANAIQKTLPQAWNDPETLATLDTDAILFGPGEGQFAKHLSTESLFLTWGESFDTLFKNAHILTEYIGIGHGKISDWRAQLQSIKSQTLARSHAGQQRPKILYLTRSGGSAGAGTFVDTAITAAGGDNVITAPGWVTPDPEYLITLNPDLIITSYFQAGYESVQATGIRHQTIRKFIAARPLINIPGALWPCAGPGLIEATDRIAMAIEAWTKTAGRPQ